MKGRLRYWLPAILWGAAILLASTDAFSAQHSGGLLKALVLAIRGAPLSPERFELMHFLIRKAAHLTEYGILSALLFRALRSGRIGWTWRWAVLATIISTAVAVVDERHQSFVASRTGSPNDVLLDTAGAAAAQIVIRVAQVLF